MGDPIFCSTQLGIVGRVPSMPRDLHFSQGRKTCGAFGVRTCRDIALARTVKGVEVAAIRLCLGFSVAGVRAVVHTSLAEKSHG